MQTRRWRGSIALFLTSALNVGEWSASHLGRALPRGMDPRYQWIRRWVDLRARLDTEARGKVLCRGSNPGCPVRSQPCVHKYIYIERRKNIRTYLRTILMIIGVSPTCAGLSHAVTTLIEMHIFVLRCVESLVNLYSLSV
jgi:hypothetical protein